MAKVGRQRRDGVSRLSGPPLLVLTSLISGPKHGHALIKDIEAFSGVTLGPGTLYGALGRLVERGLIQPLPDQDRRHPYAITDEGVQLCQEAIDEMSRLVDEGRVRLSLIPAAAT
jgi:DNA-binding PadR family transcriptional regulator